MVTTLEDLINKEPVYWSREQAIEFFMVALRCEHELAEDWVQRFERDHPQMRWRNQ